MDALEQPRLCEKPWLGMKWSSPSGAATDLSWMRSTVSVYVVHLPSATDRWQMVSAYTQHELLAL